MCYAYNADIYCDACGKEIKKDLDRQGIEDEGDTDGYPQWFDDGSEADSPQHCGNGEDCLFAEEVELGWRVGCFLENELTTDGIEYVKEQHQKSPSAITRRWVDFYGIKEEPEEDEED